jgi:hypothetical protein
MVVVYVRMFAGGPSGTADAESIVPTLIPTSPTSPSISAEPDRDRLERMELSEPLTHELTRNPFVANAAWLRNASGNHGTFAGGSGRKNAEPGSGAQALELQSTICSERPMAVINGRLVRPGDVIEGFVLEQVEPTRVWLKRNNVRRELKLVLSAETSGHADRGQ